MDGKYPDQILHLPGLAEWPYYSSESLDTIMTKFNYDLKDAGKDFQVDIKRSAPRRVRAAIGGAPFQAQLATLKNYYDEVYPIYYQANLPDPKFRKTAQTPPRPTYTKTNFIVRDKKDGKYHLVDPPGWEKEQKYGYLRPAAEAVTSVVAGLVPGLKGANIWGQLVQRGVKEGIGGNVGRLAYDAAAGALLGYEDPRSAEEKAKEQAMIFGTNALLSMPFNAANVGTREAAKFAGRGGASKEVVSRNLDRMRRLTGSSATAGMVTQRGPIQIAELVLFKIPWSKQTMEKALTDFVETWGNTIKFKLFPKAGRAMRETRARYPSHSQAGGAIKEGVYGAKQKYRQVTGRPRPREGGWQQVQEARDAILYGRFHDVYPEDTLVQPDALRRLRNQLASQPEGNAQIISEIDKFLADYASPRLPEIGAPPARGGAPQPGMGRPLTGQVNRPGMGQMNVPATQPPDGRIPQGGPTGPMRDILGQPQPYPGIPYRDYKSFRATFGDKLSPHEAVKNLKAGQTEALYAAVSEDIVNSIAHVNPADRAVGRRALQYWRHAELNHAASQQLKEEILEKISDKYSRAAIYNAFRNLARGEKADVDAVKQIMNALNGEQRDLLRRNFMMDIGWSADHQMWDPGKAFRGWHNLPKESKDALYPTDTSLRKYYDEMAKMVSSINPTVRMTQTPAFAESYILAPGAALLYGTMQNKFLVGAMTAAVMIRGPKTAAELLTSPKFMDWLVSTAKALPSERYITTKSGQFIRPSPEETFNLLISSIAGISKFYEASDNPTELAAASEFAENYLKIISGSLDAVIDPASLLEESKRGPTRPQDVRVNPEAILLGGGR